MKKNIITSFAIISFFNVLDRVLGFLFKIYLSRQLGAGNMGVYQIAVSIFFILLSFIASGIPLVVSKLVAGYLSVGDGKSAGKATSSALLVGLITALILCAITLAFAPALNSAVGKTATDSLLFMLPSLLFSAVYGALRGNLWGREKYLSVSIVEIVEQLSRILSCVIMIALGVNGLTASSVSLTVGCAFAALACVVLFCIHKCRLFSPFGAIKQLLSSELPITLSKSATTLVNSLTSIVVPALFVASGYDNDHAMSLFGASVGMALPILFAPMTIIGALAFVLVPSLSVKNVSRSNLNLKIHNSICFSIIVACAFIPLFYSCGPLIGEIVYDNPVSGQFMKIASWIIIPMSVKAITASIMNSLDSEMKSLINSMIAYAVEGAIFLIMRNGFTLQALAVGMGAELTVASFLNIVCIARKTGLSHCWALCLIKNTCLCFPCCLLTTLLLNIFRFLPGLTNVFISGGIGMTSLLVLALAFSSADLSVIVGNFRLKKRRTKKV